MQNNSDILHRWSSKYFGGSNCSLKIKEDQSQALLADLHLILELLPYLAMVQLHLIIKILREKSHELFLKVYFKNISGSS